MDDERSAANKKAREEKKKALLQAMRDSHLGQFRNLESEPMQSVAACVHLTLDGVLERDRAKDRSSRGIQCAKGCDHCCRIPVEVFPHEAAMLVSAAEEAGIAVDLSRLERQSRYGTETWREQPPHDRACVFLGDNGACKVYAQRPNACRKLLVLTEAQFCDTEKHSGERVGRWISWEAEVLASAALELFGTRLMPDALLEALHAKKDAASS